MGIVEPEPLEFHAAAFPKATARLEVAGFRVLREGEHADRSGTRPAT